MTNRSFDRVAGRADLRLGAYQPVAPIDVAGLLLGLWRGKWIIIFTVICAVVLAGYYAFARAVPSYAATATIKLELPDPQLSDPAFSEISPTRLNTEAAVLQSRHILEQVIDTLELESDPEFNRYLLPATPWSVNGICDRARALILGQPAPEISQSDLRDKTIENLSNMLRTGPERGTYLLTVTATTTSPLKSQTIANAVAQAYLADQLRARVAETDASVARLTQRVSQLQQDLQAKEAAINAMLSAGQMTDETLFDRLSHQVNDANQRLNEAQNSPDNATQIAALQALQDRLGAELAIQSEGLIQLQQLRREAQSTRVLYTTLLAQLQQVQIAHDSDTPTARVLSAATPGRYVAPRKTYILAIAALLGAALGTAYVLLQRQRHIQSDTLAGQADWPVVAHLPATAAPKFDGSALPCPAQNAANQLRTAVLSSKSAAPPQVIMVTSCRADDGHTQAADALAQSLARLERSVLLIAAESMPQSSPCNNTPTIGDIIASGDPMATPDHKEGITRIRAYAPSECPADVFTRPTFIQFLNAARSLYDHVIIVAAPICRFPDAAIIAPQSDAVVITLRDRKTRTRDWETAQTALRQIAVTQQPLIVLTN
ncbi:MULTISPECIES: exopolysaccharide transport family protein [Rhodobacterales]|uniref:exopolysaccharide transport family protein n=1 Tax=Rhodobacterales TaxID=204455 RepID=UPI0011BE265D|nr:MULTISPECIES: Wzz/FepE/Etk N-terminal domain-containing protein [Rhodobacterales]MDO6588957.1 Wzz/FepE/Etk N-terminal domain-containing protein [Yoonia sp. 1_MG-2023]